MTCPPASEQCSEPQGLEGFNWRYTFQYSTVVLYKDDLEILMTTIDDYVKYVLFL